MPTDQLRQPSYLFVRQNPGVEEGVVVLGPPPLVVPVVEKNQEPQPTGDDVVRHPARPKLGPVPFEELVPLVPASSECHRSHLSHGGPTFCQPTGYTPFPSTTTPATTSAFGGR